MDLSSLPNLHRHLSLPQDALLVETLGGCNLTIGRLGSHPIWAGSTSASTLTSAVCRSIYILPPRLRLGVKLRRRLALILTSGPVYMVVVITALLNVTVLALDHFEASPHPLSTHQHTPSSLARIPASFHVT